MHIPAGELIPCIAWSIVKSRGSIQWMLELAISTTIIVSE